MDYNNKVKNIFKTKMITASQTEIEDVASQLNKTKANYQTDDEWFAAANSYLHAQRNNPLKAEIQKQVTEFNNKCCLKCGKEGEPITLMKGRPAFFCRTHNVVMPATVQ